MALRKFRFDPPKEGESVEIWANRQFDRARALKSRRARYTIVRELVKLMGAEIDELRAEVLSNAAPGPQIVTSDEVAKAGESWPCVHCGRYEVSEWVPCKACGKIGHKAEL